MPPCRFASPGLDPAPFRQLYHLPEAELARHGVSRAIATATPGFPDRIELRDAAPGESLLLLNYTHQPANTPYRASHAIFVREGADCAYDRIGEVPAPLACRTISLRAFDAGHLMTDAALVEGPYLSEAIARLLADPATSYLQAHYATRGCYAARVDRVPVGAI